LVRNPEWIKARDADPQGKKWTTASKEIDEAIKLYAYGHSKDKYEKYKDIKIENMEIKTAGLFLNPVMSDVFHQVLYLCAEAGGKSYYFVADRAARDPSHDVDSKTLLRSILDTYVRLTLYKVHRHAGCSAENDKKFNPYQKDGKGKTFPQINETDPKKALELVLKHKAGDKAVLDAWDGNVTVPVTQKTTLDQFFNALLKYGVKYPLYNTQNNCQHFATGFYRYLTGQKEFKHINLSYMLKHHPNDFAEFFDGSSFKDFHGKHKDLISLERDEHLEKVISGLGAVIKGKISSIWTSITGGGKKNETPETEKQNYII